MAKMFNELAQRAQTLHGDRSFAEAVLTWELAEERAPDAMELARVQRGHGSSLWRVSQDAGVGKQAFYAQAVSLLREALETHDQAVIDAPGEAEPLRQRGETRAVLGRAMLDGVIGSELNSWLFSLRDDGNAIITSFLDPAKADITAAEELTGKTDQHDINMLARLGMAHSLYGSYTQGATYSYSALALGARSESRRVHLPAGLSLPYVGRAKARATARGAAAVGVHLLALSPSPTARRRALQITKRAL